MPFVVEIFEIYFCLFFFLFYLFYLFLPVLLQRRLGMLCTCWDKHVPVVA